MTAEEAVAYGKKCFSEGMLQRDMLWALAQKIPKKGSQETCLCAQRAYRGSDL